MDVRTGEVLPAGEVYQRLLQDPSEARFYTPVPNQPRRKKTGRNEPCPCGSGKKFKKCCYMKGV